MESVRQASTRVRRRDILEAAQHLFVRDGVGATTVDDICERSGASVGSLYHHFPGGKDAIAATLYLENLAEYQQGFLQELHRHREPAAGIRATVLYYLRWVQDHREATRFIFRYGDLELQSRTDPSLAHLNSAFFTGIRAWAADAGAVELVRLPVDLAVAIWIGPSHQYARRWLAGGAPTAIDDAAQVLAGAAWGALSASANRAAPQGTGDSH
jgi:AcrR family transcriptional regulator